MSAQPPPAEGDLPGVFLARAIRRNIIAGALGSLYGMLVIGFFLAGYARALGLTKVQFGFMAAIPMLVFPARLLSSLIVERLGRRKNFFTVTAILSRLIWVAILLLPFILTDISAFRSVVFLMLLLASSAIGVMSEPAWYSWMGDLIPERMRARLWSKRYIYISTSTIIPTIIIALIKDAVGREGHLGSEFAGFAIVFGFAIFCGVVDIIIHYSIPEPAMSRQKTKPHLVKMLLEPVRDARFRPFLVFRGAYAFSLAIIGLFGYDRMFEVLEGTAYRLHFGPDSLVVGKFTLVALISSVNIITGIIGYAVWGTVIERYGNKPVVQLCTLFTCFTPLPWLFVTTAHPFWPTVLIFSVSGLVYSGLNVSLLNLFYGLSPRKNRSAYVAVSSTVVGLCSSLAPILTGYFIGHMEARMPPPFTAFNLVCLIAAATRLYTRTLLYRVHEGKSVTPGYLFRRITEANPFRVFPSIYTLTAPATEERKISAVSRLALSRSKLATKDLVKHLDDPSPRVREEAASALAKSKDPEAVDALIEKLGSREHGLELQSAHALGQIGDGRGVQPLIDSLAHPDPRVRATAARALGEIGDRRASEPLFNLLKNEQDEATFGSYATALSSLGEISAIWHILPVMRDTRSVVFRRQLAVAIGNLLGKLKVFYGYLDEECKVFGQRVSKMFNRCRRLISRRQNNPLYDFRNRLLELIDTAETAYLCEDWPDCADRIAAITEILRETVLNLMVSSGSLQPGLKRRNLDKFEKILLIIGQNERLGTQLWYCTVLSPDEDPDFDKLTFEGCLLDIYALHLVVERMLTRRPGGAEPDQAAGDGLGQ